MSLDTQPPHLTPADLALAYAGGGGGGLSYERGADARRKFWIKPLKQTNLGLAQPCLTPKNDHFKLWLQESSK